MLMCAAAQQYGWTLNYGGVALMWRGGCIIRSAFLGKIGDAYAADPQLQNLLLRRTLRRQWKMLKPPGGAPWRVPSSGHPCAGPVQCAGLFDGYRRERLPANMTQAQRDYLARTPTSADPPRGEFFHTNWTGTGGAVTASTYQA